MRTTQLCAYALGLALLLAALPVAGATNEAITRPITLGIGGGSTLTLPRAFDTIMVGNPDIVEVQPQDNRTVLLKALNIGESNIVFLDEQSVVIDNIKVVVSDART
jgi:Flp pilus assembly secretin CpaC